MAGSIFELHPPNAGKSDIFRRSTTNIIIIFRNFNHYKSCKKCIQAIRPGVEESLDILSKWYWHKSLEQKDFIDVFIKTTKKHLYKEEKVVFKEVKWYSKALQALAD